MNEQDEIPIDQWKWYGRPAHLIVGEDCRFHLATVVGDYLISTVGQYLPDESVRESLAELARVRLEGRGDRRRADYMNKVGYREIGYQRLFETMVFRVAGYCSNPGCDCGMPLLGGHELATEGYNTVRAATEGHMEFCRKFSSRAYGTQAEQEAAQWLP